MSKDDTFCVLPWILQHVKTTGEILPCCEYMGILGTVKNDGLDQAWQSDSLKQLRDEMDAGIKPKGCWKCFEREGTDGTSLRTDSNLRFSDWTSKLKNSKDRESYKPRSPIAYDLRLSNLCNFKCRSCYHNASSKWFTDAKALGWVAGDKAEIRSFENSDDVFNHFAKSIDTVEEIYFAGGEPIMMAEHAQILKLLHNNGRFDVRLMYTTNLSLLSFGKESVLDLWKQFPNVNVEASIDAIGKRGELIRNGFSWETWYSNLEKIQKECPHIILYFGITVSAFNILLIPELLRELIIRFDARPHQFRIHSLQESTYYRSQILPRSIKDSVPKLFRDFHAEIAALNYWNQDEIDQLEEILIGLIAFMEAEDRTDELSEFRDKTEKLDKLRNENTQTLFPELAEIWT